MRNAIKLAALLFGLLLLVACSPEAKDVKDMGLTYRHDAAHRVSCWTRESNVAGISCLPDSQVYFPTGRGGD